MGSNQKIYPTENSGSIYNGTDLSLKIDNDKNNEKIQKITRENGLS